VKEYLFGEVFDVEPVFVLVLVLLLVLVVGSSETVTNAAGFSKSG